MIGPGKYDAEVTAVRTATGAAAVMLMVVGGYLGSGFSVQSIESIPPRALADLLEATAAQIRADNNPD